MMQAAVLLALSAVVKGHLTLQQPVPYSKDTLTTSPLSPDGSNYPCQLRDNAFEVGQENMITVGKPYEMTWDGSASHGGGTCQLSVTLDRAPTAKSTFKVITSWIGGCPTANSSGGTHPFEWTMPPEVPNGKATLAWNWVSKLSGGPENYMNCAPVTVAGGSSNTDEFDNLENLFKVNLPATECGSQSSQDLEIPNPGKYVTTFGSTALATPTGTGCAAMGQASATEGSAAASGTTSSPSSAAGDASSAPTASTGSGTSTSQVSLALPTISANDPATSPAGSGVPPSPTGSPSSGSFNGGNSTAGVSACSTDGVIVCNGSTQFGICNHGSVVWQDVAAGTTCNNGQVTKKRSIDVVRHARHPHGTRF